jgi:hypothetical protein
MWLDDRRGQFIDWSTQRWVQLTGRRVLLRDHPWLEGPVGKPTGIGTGFFAAYAAEHALRVTRVPICGLLPDIRQLAGPDCDPTRIARGRIVGTAPERGSLIPSSRRRVFTSDELRTYNSPASEMGIHVDFEARVIVSE